MPTRTVSVFHADSTQQTLASILHGDRDGLLERVLSAAEVSCARAANQPNGFFRQIDISYEIAREALSKRQIDRTDGFGGLLMLAIADLVGEVIQEVPDFVWWRAYDWISNSGMPQDELNRIMYGRSMVELLEGADASAILAASDVGSFGEPSYDTYGWLSHQDVCETHRRLSRLIDEFSVGFEGRAQTAVMEVVHALKRAESDGLGQLITVIRYS